MCTQVHMLPKKAKSPTSLTCKGLPVSQKHSEKWDIEMPIC